MRHAGWEASAFWKLGGDTSARCEGLVERLFGSAAQLPATDSAKRGDPSVFVEDFGETHPLRQGVGLWIAAHLMFGA